MVEVPAFQEEVKQEEERKDEPAIGGRRNRMIQRKRHLLHLKKNQLRSFLLHH